MSDVHDKGEGSSDSSEKKDKSSIQSFGSYIKSSSQSEEKHSSMSQKSKLSKMHRATVHQRKSSMQRSFNSRQTKRLNNQENLSEIESELEEEAIPKQLKYFPAETIIYFKKIAEQYDEKIRSIEDENKQDKYRRKVAEIIASQANRNIGSSNDEKQSKSISDVDSFVKDIDYDLKREADIEEIIEEGQDAFLIFMEMNEKVSNPMHSHKMTESLENIEQSQENLDLRRKMSEQLRSNQMEKESQCSYQLRDMDYRRFCSLFNNDQLYDGKSIDSQDQTSGSEKFISLNRLQVKYEQLYKRDVNSDPYFLQLVQIQGFRKLIAEFREYRDPYCLLTIRKSIVFSFNALQQLCQYFVESRFFQVFMFIAIFLNQVLCINQNLSNIQTSVKNYQITFIGIYIIELSTKLLSYGFYFNRNSFFREFWNLYDTVTLGLYIYHVYYPNDFEVDVTPLRLVRLLSYIASIFKGLKIMLTAIRESIKNLSEVLAIVFIFLLFFSSIGIHLFKQLHYNRCMEKDTGFMQDPSTWLGCGFYQCSPDMICVQQLDLLQITTNFNSVEYAFAQLLRTIAQDDWSTPMYFNMRAFHPQIWIFYVAIIFIVHFFAFNLVIAVLKTHYSKVTKEYEIMDFEERKLRKRNWIYDENRNDEEEKGYNIKLLKEEGQYQIIKNLRLLFLSVGYINSLTKIVAKPKTISRKLTFRPSISRDRSFPRTLSGKMLNEEKESKKGASEPLSKSLHRYCRYFNLKTFLLPYYWELIKVSKKLIRNGNEGTLIYQMIFKMIKGDIAHFSTQIKHNQAYISSSQFDIMKIAKLQQIFLRNKEAELKILRSSKVKFFYSNQTKHRNTYNNQCIDNKELYRRMPLSKRVRKLITSTEESSQSSQLSSFHEVQQNRDKNLTIKHSSVQLNQAKNLPIKFTSKGSFPSELKKEKLPFTIHQGTYHFVRIRDIYLDFEGVRRLINQRLCQADIKRDRKQLTYEEKYFRLRKKELKQKLIRRKNWSGKNVLLPHQQQGRDLINRFKKSIESLNKKDLEIWLTGFVGYVTVLRKHIYYFVNAKPVKFLFDLAVLINMIFLTLDGLIDDFSIQIVTSVVSVLLLIEIIFKIIAFNPKRFAKNHFHVFETTIIVLNFVQLFIGEGRISQQVSRMIRATISLLIYRCLKYHPFAVIVFAIAKKTFKQYNYMIFLLIFMIFQYGILGTELYAGKFDQTTQLGQLHSFDDPGKAFATVFNTMTNDDWYGVLYMGVEINKFYALAYSFSMMIIINYCTFGLVIAVMLDGFSQYLEEEEDNSDNEFVRKKEKAIDKLQKQLDSDDSLRAHSSSSNSSSSSEDQELLYLKNQTKKIMDLRSKQYKVQFYQAQNKQLCTDQIMQDQMYKSSIKIRRLKEKINLGDKIKGQQSKALNILLQHIKISEKRYKIQQNPFSGIKCKSSLFLFDLQSPVRKLAIFVTKNMIQSYLTDAVFLLSCFVFCVETYDEDFDHQSQQMLKNIQQFCNIFILVVTLIKIIAVGMWMDKGAYFNHIWKSIDFVYTVGFFLDYPLIRSQLPIIKYLQYLGFLRPMLLLYRIKLISRMREALALAFIDLFKVGTVLFGVWLMFAIFGMTLYSNQFQYCDDMMNFYVNQTSCLQNGGQWINYKHNFDNITQALPTLFIISSFDGWGYIMQLSYNSQTPDKGPEPFIGLYQTLIFYFVFCFIGVMFFVSFLTGVFYINLRHHEKRLENKDLTQEQIEFMEISKVIFYDQPQYSSPPRSLLRRYASYIVKNQYAPKILFYILTIDTVAQLMYRTDVTDQFLRGLNYIYQIISILLIFWVICQFLTHGILRFFEHGWRRFEFIISIINTTDLILDLSIGWFDIYLKKQSGEDYFQAIRLFITLRDLRILLIFRRFVQLRRLIRVMVFSLPFLFKLSAILLSVFVSYSLLGSELYSGVQKGELMDDLINFRNFSTSMLTLFKVATQDNWRTIMTDLMFYNPYCQIDSYYCGRPLAQIYFISFMVIAVWCLLNPLVLGIVSQFETFHADENSCIQTYVESIDVIKTVWCKYTSETQGKMMHIKFLASFLLDIKQPLGANQNDNLWDVAKLASSFKLRANPHGYILFNQLLYEMVRKKFKDKVFKKGSKHSIEKINLFDKEMSFRLIYQRKDRKIQRSNIGPQINLKGNVFILRDYLSVLTLFKTWQAYSKNLITHALNENIQVFTEQSLGDQEFDSDKFDIFGMNTATQTDQVRIDSFKEDKLNVSENSLDPNFINELPIYEIQKGTSKKLKVQFEDNQEKDFQQFDIICPSNKEFREKLFWTQTYPNTSFSQKQIMLSQLRLRDVDVLNTVEQEPHVTRPYQTRIQLFLSKIFKKDI